MKIERLTDKEAICITVPFISGGSLILGIGSSAGNDALLAVLAGFLMAVPMILIYARTLVLYPGKDLFEILIESFGKIAGRIIIILYVTYFLHIGAVLLRSFGEFTTTIAMPGTPMVVPTFAMGFICVVAVRMGIEVLGRTTAYFIPMLFLILLTVSLLSAGQFDMNNLKPVLSKGFASVLRCGFSVFAFPFAETVMLMGAFSGLKSKKSPYKVYFLGVGIGAAVILATTLRNISVLGNQLMHFQFPSYEAVSIIKTGNFIERIEVSVAIIFIFGIFVKASVCLMVACKGICTVFGLSNFRSVAIQVGVLMVSLSSIVFENIMDMQYGVNKVYPFLAFPVQVIVPVIVWIAAEIKNGRINPPVLPADSAQDPP